MANQGLSQALPIAAAFAKLSGRAAAQSNANRRQISEANIAAETAGADLALREQRSRMAQAFAKQSGILATNAAYRGSSIADPSVEASLLSAAFRATHEVAIAEANRAAQVASIRARHAFIEEDVTLASIEGALRGLSVGLDIAAALQAMTEVRQQRRTEILQDPGAGNFGFADIIEDIAFTPGLNLGDFDLSNLGIDLG
jgi:hypothetical protein